MLINGSKVTQTTMENDFYILCAILEIGLLSQQLKQGNIYMSLCHSLKDFTIHFSELSKAAENLIWCIVFISQTLDHTHDRGVRLSREDQHCFLKDYTNNSSLLWTLHTMKGETFVLVSQSLNRCLLTDVTLQLWSLSRDILTNVRVIVHPSILECKGKYP